MIHHAIAVAEGAGGAGEAPASGDGEYAIAGRRPLREEVDVVKVEVARVAIVQVAREKDNKR